MGSGLATVTSEVVALVVIIVADIHHDGEVTIGGVGMALSRNYTGCVDLEGGAGGSIALVHHDARGRISAGINKAA